MPLIIDDLGPVTIHSSQNSHVLDEDLTHFRFLHILTSEFSPSSLLAELDQ